MPVYQPIADASRLRDALAPSSRLLVACLCAAWCGTCREYEPKFAELSERFEEHVFVWVDVEDHPELLDDEDIEDFPTLLIQSDSHTLFYGPMLPHIGHLERLLESLAASAAPATVTQAPSLRQALA